MQLSYQQQTFFFTPEIQSKRDVRVIFNGENSKHII